MAAKSYKELRIWQTGKLIVVEVYRITRQLPDCEQFGLISQMRRASVSVPANIAEGFGRGQPKELKRFLHIALGSCAELQTLLEISQELNYVQDSNLIFLFDKIDHESKMLMNYIQCL